MISLLTFGLGMIIVYISKLFKLKLENKYINFILTTFQNISPILIIFVILVIISLKTGYINNITISINEKNVKYLSIENNKNISDETLDRLEIAKFNENLIVRAKKDITYNSIYVLSQEPTMGTYNYEINTLSLTEDIGKFGKTSNVKNEIKEGLFDETIIHESIHYFLSDKDFRKKVFDLHSKILNRDLNNIKQYYYEDTYEQQKVFSSKSYQKYIHGPFSKMNLILNSFDYNNKDYTLDKFLEEFDNYENNDYVRILREELLTFYMQSEMNLQKIEIVKNDPLYYELYMLFFTIEKFNK